MSSISLNERKIEKKKKLWVNNYLTFEVVVLSMNQHTCATKSKHIIKIIEKEKESILEKK